MRVAITCGHETQSENTTELSKLLHSLPNKAQTTKSSLIANSSLPSRAFFTLPYSVNYAALTLRGIPYTHPDSGVLRVLAKYIDQKRIHPEIREKGGAYGGSARFKPLEGIFAFTSYRDPSFERTLDIMRDAGRWMTEQKISDEMLDEMKLSIFKDIDSPISVQQEGMQQFMHGITPDLKQMYSPPLL
jgi:Zn-dependent M16 (insulinase) family peptidase